MFDLSTLLELAYWKRLFEIVLFCCVFSFCCHGILCFCATYLQLFSITNPMYLHCCRCNLPAVADALRSYFSNKLPPHQAYLTEVAKELSRTSRGSASEADMRDRVRKVSHIVPEWCIVTDNSHHVASKFGNAYMKMGRPPPTMRRLLSRAQPPIVKLNHSLRYNEVRDILCFMVEEN